MSQTFEALLPDLLGAKGLVNVPPEIGVFQLRKALIEFCERSHVWQHTLSIDAQEGVSDYPIEVPAGARFIAVSEIEVNGCRMRADGRDFRIACACRGLRVEDETLWVTSQNQDEEQAILVRVAVKPTQEACEFPEFLYQDWSDVIVDGAASRCFTIPKSSWTSAALATFYTKRFLVGITRAKNARVMRKVTGPLRMRGERF